MELHQIIFLIFLGIVVINLFGLAVYCRMYDAWNVFIPMPKDIKDNTEMNWFGCIVCYILLFILFPVWNIGQFIYWLFHI